MIYVKYLTVFTHFAVLHPDDRHISYEFEFAINARPNTVYVLRCGTFLNGELLDAIINNSHPQVDKHIIKLLCYIIKYMYNLQM